MNECNGQECGEKKSMSECDIESHIAKEEYYTVGEKTTVCVLTLVNGFEVVGLSSCVSKENYDQELGAPIARKKAVDMIWTVEGYLLQEMLWQSSQMNNVVAASENAYVERVDCGEIPDPQPPIAA